MPVSEEAKEMAGVVLDAISDCVLFLDSKRCIRWANRAAIDLSGLEPGDLYENHCYKVWYDRKEACPDCPVKRVFETGKTQEFETTGPGEKRFSVRAYAIRNERGEIRGVSQIATDITERKQAERTLRESEERYRSLIQASPDGITFSDLRGNLITANEQAAHMYGCDSVEELMNSASTAFDFVAPEDRQRALQNAKRTFDEGVLRNLEYKLIRKDGSTYPVELSASTVKDADGKPMGFVGVIRDITKRKRTEQERMRLQEQFQHAQKMESLGILAGGIAHDFNNLLMGILGNAGLACMDLPEGSPARHSVEQIEKAGRAAADLINQMLAYSGKGHFVVEPVNMSRLVEEMTGLLKVSVSKKIDLKFDFDRDIPAVEADASQLRQVIMNLITNASEAIEDQPGVVSVRTGIMETTREFFSKTYTRTDLPEGTYVYLEVSDSGCGMDNETLGRIFDPFFSTKFTGRGLGLAAVLGIVRGHNGAIRVKSELGQGTTIKVVFPPCETQDYQPAHEKTETSTAEHSGTILVVDDEVTVRDVSERMLRNSGFDVITARDGMEALEKFRNHTDEIVGVLLDATMPGMDGPQTFENLRHIREDIRVILSSGYNEQEATERFADKGLAGFIQKPYRINELIDIIDEVLD